MIQLVIIISILIFYIVVLRRKPSSFFSFQNLTYLTKSIKFLWISVLILVVLFGYGLFFFIGVGYLVSEFENLLIVSLTICGAIICFSGLYYLKKHYWAIISPLCTVQNLSSLSFSVVFHRISVRSAPPTPAEQSAFRDLTVTEFTERAPSLDVVNSLNATTRRIDEDRVVVLCAFYEQYVERSLTKVYEPLLLPRKTDHESLNVVYPLLLLHWKKWVPVCKVVSIHLSTLPEDEKVLVSAIFFTVMLSSVSIAEAVVYSITPTLLNHPHLKVLSDTFLYQYENQHIPPVVQQPRFSSWHPMYGMIFCFLTINLCKDGGETFKQLVDVLPSAVDALSSLEVTHKFKFEFPATEVFKNWWAVIMKTNTNLFASFFNSGSIGHDGHFCTGVFSSPYKLVVGQFMTRVAFMMISWGINHTPSEEE